MKKEEKWYLNPLFIGIMFAGWPLIVPIIVGIILALIKLHDEKKQKLLINQLSFDKVELKNKVTQIYNKVDEFDIKDHQDAKIKLDNLNKEIQENNTIVYKLRAEIQELTARDEKLQKSVENFSKKLAKSKEIYKSIDYALDNFLDMSISCNQCKISSSDLEEAELIAPSVILKLHCMDVKSLRKAYRDNEKLIDSLLLKYSTRYTTKANKSIYDLMVIALRSELQNIMINLKYEKLDDAINHLKDVSAKYLTIAGEGNQTIAGTLTKFIGEIEYLFTNSIKIEYNYYVKKEQAKQEQLALREQMRQEAEERKALEQEKKRVLKEEEKYNSEITKLQETLSTTSDESDIDKLKSRILELQTQLSDVIVKKDEITNLQNGKAGTVYIISNLGSFGDNVFKVGMTRRLEPFDRINELGSASVPFKFDVHSFIFSKDAVALENKMHEILNNYRVNKVNMRKEFFKISLDELEKIVYDIEPTAEFNRTMAAEEFRQSLSSDSNYTDSYSIDNNTEEDEDE